MYRVICEWDIGITDYIFSTFDVAMKNARDSLELCGIDDTFEELNKEGLIYIEQVRVINE